MSGRDHEIAIVGAGFCGLGDYVLSPPPGRGPGREGAEPDTTAPPARVPA